MIPKIIHYCWFGPNPIPKIEQQCIESWKKFFPDFEFKFWNEETFDVNSVVYTKQAYENKKYAFVSDYVRVYVLEKYGGIYLDTDFEILNSGFREIIESQSPLLGFETRYHLGTAVMSFTKHHGLMNEFLNYYINHKFIDENGWIDNIANVTILSDLLKKRGFVLDGSYQKKGDITLFNRDFFYPKKINNEKFLLADVTCGIHRCSNSWMSERQKKRGSNKLWINFIRPILQNGRKIGLKIIGEKNIHKLEVWIRNKLK